MEHFKDVATKLLDKGLNWFHWLTIGKNLAFDKRIDLILIWSVKNLKTNEKNINCIIKILPQMTL